MRLSEMIETGKQKALTESVVAVEAGRVTVKTWNWFWEDWNAAVKAETDSASTGIIEAVSECNISIKWMDHGRIYSILCTECYCSHHSHLFQIYLPCLKITISTIDLSAMNMWCRGFLIWNLRRRNLQFGHSWNVKDHRLTKLFEHFNSIL